jgi:hypothetical protein
VNDVLKNMITQARNSFSDIWKKDFIWKYNPAGPERGDPEHWTMGCEVFTVHVTHYGNNLFDVAVLWGHNSDQVFESEKIKSDLETMKGYASEVAQQFLQVGMLNWFGFDLTLTRPVDEIRFKQITAGVDGRLFGLAEEGTVFRFDNGQWAPMLMKTKTFGI